MKNKIKQLRQKKQSDTAAGITIFGLFAIMVFMMMAIFLVDMGKNIYMQNTYFSMITRSAQEGIKDQNSIGGLTSKSAQSIVDEYMKERNGVAEDGHATTRATEPFRAICAKAKEGEYPKITITYGTQRNNKGTSSNGVETGSMSTDMTFSSNGGSSLSPSVQDPSTQGKFFANKYRTIQVNIEDYGDNYFFNMFGGAQCPIYKIQTTAVAVDADTGNTGK